MSELKFVRTISIAKFKAINNVSAIKVIKNPNEGGKVFFSCPDDTTISGKVSTKLDIEKEMVISFCEEDNASFYMLHNANDSTENTIVTL